MMPGEANEDYAAFVRQKIRERVKNPVVAEKLVPKDYMFGSKRLPCQRGYYEVYNQDNVLLVDVHEAPSKRITPRGVKPRDAEYELDVLIFATGYDAVTGALNRIAIRGEGGQTRLLAYWILATFLLCIELVHFCPLPFDTEKQTLNAIQYDTIR